MYYDLSDELDRYAKVHRLGFKYDSHYNEDTHKFIGHKLDMIIKRDIIKKNNGS